MMSEKHVSATGLSGLVGSRVQELLVDDVQWEEFPHKDGFDMIDAESVLRFVGRSIATVVVHFAAFTDMNQAEKQKGDIHGSCYQLNVIGSRNVAQACKQCGKHLICIATDAVFDGKKRTAYTEEDTPHPISWYGETKWLGEQEVMESGCAFTIVRISYPFRARFDRKLDFVRKTIKKLQEKQKITVFDDTLFTPTFIDDIAHVLKSMIRKKSKGMYHVVGSTALSPYDAIRTIADVFDLDKTLIYPQKFENYLRSGGRPYPRYAALSNEKLRKELDSSMKIFSEALKEMKMQLS